MVADTLFYLEELMLLAYEPRFGGAFLLHLWEHVPVHVRLAGVSDMITIDDEKIMEN